MENVTSSEIPNQSRLVTHGVIGGIISGVVFILAEMIINVLILGAPFLGPLRLISTIVLGTQAVQPTYPLGTAVIVGVIVHLILASIFGVIFVFLLSLFRQSRASAILQLVYGAIYGLALWVVNFLIIAPILFPQFGNANPFWNGFFAHTFFYGAVFGIYNAIALGRGESKPGMA